MLRALILSTLFPDATRPNFGVFVERQTHALAARGDMAVHVVAPLGIAPWPLSLLSARHRALAHLPAHEQWRGLPVDRPHFVNLPGTGGRFHPRALVAALAPHLARLRRRFPFDVINAEFFFPDGVAAVELGRRLGVPVAIKARGADIHYWAHRPATAPAILDAARRADALLAISDAMRGDMIALGMPADRIETVRTGVDLDRFVAGRRAEARAALGVAGPLVVATGALVPRKGHDIVIDAVARLAGVQLWIAGEGPERPALEHRIAASGVGDRIRLLGSVDHAAIPDLVAAADVMALASASEGLANAWVEALASGTPIVIPDVGGAREVVRDSACGRIVARDAAAFAAAIAALLADPPAPDAARSAVTGFTWAANSERLAGLLHRIAATA